MIVRKLAELAGTEREVAAANGNWVSRRLLLARDGMGFSLHDTTIHAGSETLIHYQNHLEAVYCVGGSGAIEVLPDGPVYSITDGVMYALNGHERHLLRATTEMRMVCIFTPPLTGREDHDADGVYPLLSDHPDDQSEESS